jgi:hypothetical protein
LKSRVVKGCAADTPPICPSQRLVAWAQAIEAQRKNPFFHTALAIGQVPSAARLRQRMDTQAMGYARTIDQANQQFLVNVGVPVTPLSCGHVALDMDLFPLDNSGTRKEGVGYT